MRVLDGHRGVDQRGRGVGEAEEVVVGGASRPSRRVGTRSSTPRSSQTTCAHDACSASSTRATPARRAVTDHPPLGQTPPQHHPTDPCRPALATRSPRGLGGVDGDPEDEVTPLAHQALRRLGQGQVVDAGTPGGDHHAQQPAADGVREVLDRDRA